LVGCAFGEVPIDAHPHLGVRLTVEHVHHPVRSPSSACLSQSIWRLPNPRQRAGAGTGGAPRTPSRSSRRRSWPRPR
jgi:hypothetical protein